ncbi:MAG: toxin [Chloroflexi bacterium]|nr:toxin [Chloroflexota bacterium]
MKYFDWSTDKNDELRANRNVTFEEVVFALVTGELLDIIEHPNQAKYPNQRIFIVNLRDYAHLVPFVESEDTVFLKTIIPCRKMTQKYLGGA